MLNNLFRVGWKLKHYMLYIIHLTSYVTCWRHQFLSNKEMSKNPKCEWIEENYDSSTRTISKQIKRLQIRNKKLFTSIYFLQILTNPCRTPLLREQLLLNTSWFSYARTKKKHFSEKLIRKKIKFHCRNNNNNNNNKIICAWYLSSK